MRITTNQELTERVSELQKMDKEIFSVMQEYFLKYDASPDLRTIREKIKTASETDVFRSIMRLAAAGCILTGKGGIDLIPLISPEEAKNWCGEGAECRKACEQKLDLLIVEHVCRHNGSFPTIEDILMRYEGSPLFPVIEEHAIRYICDSYELTEQFPPRVRLSESHTKQILKALAFMKSGITRKAV